MRRDIAISSIVDLCEAGEGFRSDAAAIAAKVAAPDRGALIDALLECGVIPESFGHDSTEEKLYAKYCDVLLAKAFVNLEMRGVVIEERGDSADVEGKTDAYTIVGDAKAFRLSRTAKNQKDFKVTALSGWRGNKDFAVMVCPIYQYPSNNSQIYTQATAQNVSLLGYVHLAFLLAHFVKGKSDLAIVWNITKNVSPTRRASEYWSKVDELVCKAVGKEAKDLAAFKAKEAMILEAVKKVEILHLRGRAAAVLKLTREEAVQRLLLEMKLASRMEKISSVRYQNRLG